MTIPSEWEDKLSQFNLKKKVVHLSSPFFF